MLCSDCKKNTAVIFIDEKNKEGKTNKVGYCYKCAQKRGISIARPDKNDLSSKSFILFI